jgi:hypothetical protein
MVFPRDYIPFTEYKLKIGSEEVISKGMLTRTVAPAEAGKTYYLPETYTRVSEWREISVKVLPLVNNIRDFWVEETVDGANFYPVENLSKTNPTANVWNILKTDYLLNYIRVAVRTLDSPNPPPAALIIILEVRR